MKCTAPNGPHEEVMMREKKPEGSMFLLSLAQKINVKKILLPF